MEWLMDYVHTVYGRNADGDGFVCNNCEDTATVICYGKRDHYVCDACYQMCDEYSTQNCYKIKDGLIGGELPGSSTVTLEQPYADMDLNNVTQAIADTWHNGDWTTAALGKLMFRIVRINDQSLQKSAEARRILYSDIKNVLSWIPIGTNDAFAVCVCCDPRNAHFKKTFIYHFESENIIWNL